MIAVNIALNVNIKNNIFIRNNNIKLDEYHKPHITILQFYTKYENINSIIEKLNYYKNKNIIFTKLDLDIQKINDKHFIYKMNIMSNDLHNINNEIKNKFKKYICTPTKNLKNLFYENITYTNLENIVLDYSNSIYKPHITLGISDTYHNINISNIDIKINDIELFKIGNYGTAIPLYSPLFISHRINTISELTKIPTNFGIETDLRDYSEDITIIHDPFLKGECIDSFLKNYNHSLIILNVKSERIEFKILDYINKYNIHNYFFLDCSFPMIYNLNKLGCNNIAIRYSEFESIESVLLVKHMIKWVWIDCFTKFPLTYEDYLKIKNAGLKICIVSPELQNKSCNEIYKYKQFLLDNHFITDAICTKIYNIDKWK
jgi:hypothetical protein